MSCGHSFTVVVTAGGKLWSWGEGGCGQLGIGRVTKAATPQLVLEKGPATGAPFVDVACGWGHAVAVTKRRRVYTWGFNSKGQLGLGDLNTRHTPVQVAEAGVPPTPREEETEGVEGGSSLMLKF